MEQGFFLTESEVFRVQRNRLLSAFADLRRSSLLRRLKWALNPWGLCRHEISELWQDAPGRECQLCGELLKTGKDNVKQ